MADTRKDPRAPVSLKVRFKSATLDAVRAADVAKLAIGSGDVTRTPMLLEHHFPAVSSRLPIL